MSETHHDHGHDHAHDHHHDDDSYYLDQLCMVGLSAAFGAIGLSLYLSKVMTPEGSPRQPMLNLLLGTQFHPFVLASGVALIVVACVRAVTLWKQAAAPAHDHVHGEDCTHDHDHDHPHHHDHGHEDHDHGWAPWRYVVILVPIILYLLGLPNKGPTVEAKEVRVDMTQDAAGYAGLVALGPFDHAQLTRLTTPLFMGGRVEKEMNYKELEGLAGFPEQRDDWRGKTISVKGQFSPSPSSDRTFSLVRHRIQCCAGDAIELRVPMVCRESLSGMKELKNGDWVKITGVIDFRERGGNHFTIVQIPGLAGIERTVPDNNPWIQ